MTSTHLALALLGLGVVGQAMLLGANAFEAVVDVPNWRDPEGLRSYRGFLRRRNAGHFYRVVSPATIVLLVVALIVDWRGMSARDLLVGAALAASIAAEVFTVAYFFPRNRRLFFQEDAPPGPDERALVDQWGRANLVRIAVMVTGVACSATALTNVI